MVPYLKAIRTTLFICPVLAFFLSSIQQEWDSTEQTLLDVERLVLAHFLLNLQSNATEPDYADPREGPNLHESHESWDSYREHQEQGEITALAFRNLHTPHLVFRKALLPGVGIVHFSMYPDLGEDMQPVWHSLHQISSDSCARAAGFTAADLRENLFHARVRVRKDPFGWSPIRGTALDLYFTNVNFAHQGSQGPCLSPGATTVYFAEGFGKGSFRGFQIEGMTSNDLVDMATRVARATDIIEPDIYQIYYKLVARNEGSKVTILIVAAEVKVHVAFSLTLLLAIGIAAWQSHLVRSALSQVGRYTGDPIVFITPFVQPGSLLSAKKPVELLERVALLFLVFLCWGSPSAIALAACLHAFGPFGPWDGFVGISLSAVLVVISTTSIINMITLIQRLRRAE